MSLLARNDLRTWDRKCQRARMTMMLTRMSTIMRTATKMLTKQHTVCYLEAYLKLWRVYSNMEAQ